MNLVVGISQQAKKDYLLELIKNGVSDFFIGYVPDYWSKKYGFEISGNRRYDHICQFIDLDKLKETADLLHKYDRRIFLGINDHYYIKEQLPLIDKIVAETKDLMDRYIIAWPLLIEYLRKKYPDIKINLSGEFGTYSKSALDYASKLKVKRIIFPREVGIDEIVALVNYARKNNYNFEFEAFIMESPCLFNGAYCFMEHGYAKPTFCNSEANLRKLYKNDQWQEDIKIELIKNCGLCFLKDLQKAGVEFLKVPGREGMVLNSVKLLNGCLADLNNLNRVKIKRLAQCEKNKNSGCYYEF